MNPFSPLAQLHSVPSYRSIAPASGHEWKGKVCRNVVVMIGIVSFTFLAGVGVVSAAPRSTPFSPGETIDPGAAAQPCGPLDANCFPTISGSFASFTTSSSTATSTFSGPTSGLRATDLTSTSTERSSFGRYNMQGLDRTIGAVQQAATSNASIAFIGDSWVAGSHFVPFIYTYVNANYPFAGAGYVPVDSTANTVALSGTTKISTGTWTDTAVTGLGPTLTQTNSTDTVTPATKAVVCVGTNYTIYYLKQPNGGRFDYSVDYVSTTTIDTSNASNALGTVSITGQTYGSHTIPMTVSTAGSAGVTLFGVDCGVANSRGIKMYKLGMTGSTAANWASANASLFQSEIAALSPSAVVITLGTNDIAAASVSSYIASIKTIIANVRAANASTSILLAPPTISGRTGPAGDVSAYYGPLQDLARQNGYGYLETGKSFGSYADTNAAGYWTDTAHMNSSGDQVFATAIIDYLGLSNARAYNQGTDVYNSVSQNYLGKGMLYGASAAYNATGIENTLLGPVGTSLTIGSRNTVIGYNAGFGSTFTDSVFIGDRAGGGNGAGVTGGSNVGVGRTALQALSSGYNNATLGRDGLYSITTGHDNSSLGYQAGRGLTTGQNNVAIGAQALLTATSSNDSIAIGAGALYNNTYGFDAVSGAFTVYQNIAIGSNALAADTGGEWNNAVGYNSGQSVTNGSRNTMMGHQSFANLTTGSGNTALGFQTGNNPTGVNYNSSVDNYLLLLGYRASRDLSVAQATPLSYASAIGAQATVGCSNCMSLGGSNTTYYQKVGIGTSSPLALLTVATPLGDNTGLNPLLFMVASSSAGTATTSLFQVAANGRVGIGTSSPGAQLGVNGNIYVGGAGTSTILNNLDVLGTFHGRIVTSGDLVFANNFRIVEAPMDTAPQGLILQNQNGKAALSVDEDGNVTAAGDVCANGQQCFGKTLNQLSNTVSTLASSTALSILSTQATANYSWAEMNASVSAATTAIASLTSRMDTLSSTTLVFNDATIALLASTTADRLASSTPSFITRVTDGVRDVLVAAGSWVVGEIRGTLAIFDRVVAHKVETDTVEATQVVTQSICVDNICLGKNELKALLIQAGATATSTTGGGNTPLMASPSSTPTPTPSPIVTPTPTEAPQNASISDATTTPSTSESVIDTTNQDKPENSASPTSTPSPSVSPTSEPTPVETSAKDITSTATPAATPEPTPSEIPVDAPASSQSNQ